MVSELVSDYATKHLSHRTLRHAHAGSPLQIIEQMFENVSRCFSSIHLGSRWRTCRKKGKEKLWSTTLAHLYTVNEVCDQLKISRSTLYRLVNAGEIEPVKVRNCRRFTETAVNRYVDRLVKKTREEMVGF